MHEIQAFTVEYKVLLHTCIDLQQPYVMRLYLSTCFAWYFIDRLLTLTWISLPVYEKLRLLSVITIHSRDEYEYAHNYFRVMQPTSIRLNPQVWENPPHHQSWVIRVQSVYPFLNAPVPVNLFSHVI